MTREEYNEQFLIELAHHKETGEISDEVKNLLYLLLKDIVNSERYKYFDEDTKYMCMTFAYEACIKLIWNFNPEKSSNAYSYISIIIRSSIARTMACPKGRTIGNPKDYIGTVYTI